MCTRPFRVVSVVAAILGGCLGVTAWATQGQYYPEVANGTACYTNGASCNTQSQQWCENITPNNGALCAYCTGSVSSFPSNYCAAVMQAWTCNGSSNPVNCGDLHMGQCQVQVPGLDACNDTSILYSTGGCGTMDVNCTGTGT
jgi:hypothetical protein